MLFVPPDQPLISELLTWEPLPEKFWLLLPQTIELAIFKPDPSARMPPTPPLPRAFTHLLFATVTFVSDTVEAASSAIPAPMLFAVFPSMRQ